MISSLLTNVLVSPVSSRQEFSSGLSIKEVWNNDARENNHWKILGIHFKLHFGDFPTTIPLFDKLVLVNITTIWEGTSCHAASYHEQRIERKMCEYVPVRGLCVCLLQCFLLDVSSDRRLKEFSVDLDSKEGPNGSARNYCLLALGPGLFALHVPITSSESYL
jgi:hypothetical protein